MRGLGRATELAERFHADLERPLGELSRGNRQKIGLIQAFFHGPELLILDEPTGGLDPLMQEEFLGLLREERERGATVFLSSHELDEVQRACDSVGIIRDGRLVAVERVVELTERAYRHVSLEFDTPVDASEFGQLPGVSGLVASGSRITFKAEGDLDAVVKAAARHTVRDIEVTPADARRGLPHLLQPGRRSMSALRAPAPSHEPSLRAVVRRGLRDHRHAPLTWGGCRSARCAR